MEPWFRRTREVDGLSVPYAPGAFPSVGNETTRDRFKCVIFLHTSSPRGRATSAAPYRQLLPLGELETRPRRERETFCRGWREPPWIPPRSLRPRFCVLFVRACDHAQLVACVAGARCACIWQFTGARRPRVLVAMARPTQTTCKQTKRMGVTSWHGLYGVAQVARTNQRCLCAHGVLMKCGQVLATVFSLSAPHHHAMFLDARLCRFWCARLGFGVCFNLH